MDKVLVEVLVPIADTSFDVFIPQTSKMKDILGLITGAISDLSRGKFKANETSVLCDAETGNIYNINLSIYELEIHNGSRLLLI